MLRVEREFFLVMTDARDLTSEERAALSRGSSGDAIHALVERVVGSTHYANVVDIGCGSGAIAGRLRDRFDLYRGCDVVRYVAFPNEPWASFTKVDLNARSYPVPDACADLVLCIEAIEHVENPRALVRELVRIARPGGRIVVTTPNQLSLLSKLSLLTKNEFVAFQQAPGLYPAHITALVEQDLKRIAYESGLDKVDVHYTDSGRMPFTGRHWPSFLKGRSFSDNVLITATRAAKVHEP